MMAAAALIGTEGSERQEVSSYPFAAVHDTISLFSLQ